MRKFMTVCLVTFLATLLLTSCKASYPINNEEFIPLEKDFSNSFDIDSTADLLKLFNIEGASADNIVTIKLINENQLQLTYNNEFNIPTSRVFIGKLKKSGFKTFIIKDRLFILPVLWITQVKRLKLGHTKEGVLVINEYSNSSGMILFMAAGHSWRTQHSFIKAE